MSAKKPTLQIEHYFQNKSFFSSVLETAIDGIIIIDVNGNMLHVNPSAEKLFGYAPGELNNRNVTLLMPEPHKSQHHNYIDNHLRTGIKKIIGIGREVLGQRKDGSYFPLRLAVSQFTIENVNLFTGVIHDLTAQKEAERELWYLNKNLEKLVESRTGQLQESLNQLNEINKNLETEIQHRKSAEQKLKESETELIRSLEKERNLGLLKSRFVSIASHEFRTPLANILSSLSLIDRYEAAENIEQRKKHILKIKNNINYLNGILNEFLGLTRIEEGQVELKYEQFNLNDFLTELIEDFELIKKPGQTLELLSTPEDASFDIVTDKTCIKHVLNNLLSNAIKYSGDHSQIRVMLIEIQDSIQIEVHDNGIGIPKEDQKYIFDLFYRASNVLNIQGTGLGLSIVKKYLETIQGEMEFESSESTGTTIRIKLPKYGTKV